MTSLERWVPGLSVLRRYEAAWLPRDLAAGLVLTTLLVPAGIAYSVAAGVPAIHGLYATVFALVAYAIFGPSRIMVVGPDSSLAAVILAVVLSLSAGDPTRAPAIASAMALVAGGVCLLIGALRLGFVTELLSKPIRYGYMNGIALAVLVAQLPRLLGFGDGDGGAARQAAAVVRGVIDGRTNAAALAVGLGTLALILLLRRWPRVPGLLIAIVAATLVVQFLGLESRGAVEVLGVLPAGLPAPSWPSLEYADLVPLLIGGTVVAMVAFADTSVLSRTYAAKLGTPVDANAEVRGLGAANLAAGLFQGIPVASSATRTPVAEASGARTQLTGVTAALAVAALLVFAPRLLEHLPVSALAAVVIVAAVGLVEVRDLRRIHRQQPWEFWLSIVCCAGVVLFGVIEGIGIAVTLAVVEFLWDAWRPHYAVLGRVEGLRGYHDVARHPDARRIPGLVIFRWDAPLFFANAELFRQRLAEAVAASPTPVQRVIVSAEPVTSIDVTSADMLDELERTYTAARIELCFAEMKDPVKDKLRRFELYDRFGDRNFHPTLGAAVDAYLADHRVDWTP
ncbi:MAG: SulP family inorganic anion transporter [Steroidobacteraceae bacterium]